MKLHIYTKESASYSFDCTIEIMDDEEFDKLLQDSTIVDVLNSDEVTSIIENSDFAYDLRDAIDPLFNMESNGEFDWNEKTCEYYDLFNKHVKDCICQVEMESGKIIKQYQCVHDDCYFTFSEDCFSFCLPNFYSGNGEPIGAQLALEMVDMFMKSCHWHIGLIDSEDRLVSNISSWAKDNILDLSSIKPIVWFGKEDIVTNCWSITPDTRDLFIKTFWGNYFEGALTYICKADEGLGIYYSVWEYGLYYDPKVFVSIKENCPINIDLPNVDRTNALYNLIISIYNENKAEELPEIDIDIYSKQVIGCEVILKSEALNYIYSKPYKFHSNSLLKVDQDFIKDILWEDESYRNSFVYLKDSIIDKCDLSSCEEVGKTVWAAISDVQDCLDKSLICQIQSRNKLLKKIPLTIKLGHNNLPVEEIYNDVFIKSLIEFFKRGYWHIGYKDSSELPEIRNAMAQIIPQNGVYPVVWFNDTDEVNGKTGIWPAQQQYMLSLTWKTASDFCSHVYNNNAVHNNYRNKGAKLYKDLETEFERIKAECPIHLMDGNNPVNFEELCKVVSDYTKSNNL